MTRKPKPHPILVSRLAQWYDAFGIVGRFDVKQMLRVPAVEEYLDEIEDRPEDKRWHMGRVRYFYEKLIRGEKIDPIEVENRAHQYRISHPVTWGGPEILDGHHRFAASVLARKRRIDTNFGGLQSTLDWLTGKTRRPPKELG